MKILNIEVKYKGKIKLAESIIKKLSDKVLLATTVQYIDSVPDIKKQLENLGKKVKLLQGKHAVHDGQVHGCDCDIGKLEINEGSAVLFIGDGMFHPIGMLNEKIDISIYNPGSKKLSCMDKKSIEKINKRKKGAYLKFLSSDTIGIIRTTKFGQREIQIEGGDATYKLKKKYDKKRFYDFICDTIDYSELENFPFVDVWINTACPRIAIDDHEKLPKTTINLKDILDFDIKNEKNRASLRTEVRSII